MTDRYRVVVPELVAEYHAYLPDEESIRSVRTVLWKGDDMPGQEVIAGLLEGQAEVRSRQAEPGSMPHAYGHDLFVEKRRRARLGWYVVDSVHIPRT